MLLDLRQSTVMQILNLFKYHCDVQSRRMSGIFITTVKLVVAFEKAKERVRSAVRFNLYVQGYVLAKVIIGRQTLDDTTLSMKNLFSLRCYIFSSTR